MNPPEGYLRELDRMIRIIGSKIAEGLKPAFLLPPKSYVVVAMVEDLPAIAQNDDARKLVRALSEQLTEGPTLLMLDVALRRCNVAVQRAPSISDLGLTSASVFPVKVGTG